jgi:hypothetical protein
MFGRVPARERAPILLLGPLLCADCRPAQPVAASARPAPAPTGALEQAVVAPVVAADAGAPAPGSGCPDYAASLARGQALSGRRDFAGAIVAFDDAIRARPYDARARLERGRATAVTGGDPSSDFELARSLTTDRGLELEALLESARAQTRAKKPEKARLTYAIAAELGSKDAMAALAGQSRCTATWSTSGVPNAVIVKGWLGALSERQLVGCEEPHPEATVEAEAKSHVCRSCLAGGAWHAENPCQGKGPYRIGMGYLHCSTFTTLLQPLGGGRFYLDAANGEPLRSEGAGYVLDVGRESQFAWTHGSFQNGEDTMFNGVRWASTTIDVDPPACPIDSSAEVELAASSGCQSGPGIALKGPHKHRWFDKDGKGILEVAEHAGAVKVTLAGKKATIDGAGCSEVVALP